VVVVTPWAFIVLAEPFTAVRASAHKLVALLAYIFPVHSLPSIRCEQARPYTSSAVLPSQVGRDVFHTPNANPIKKNTNATSQMYNISKFIGLLLFSVVG
jgi:hypothetical protein